LKESPRDGTYGHAVHFSDCELVIKMSSLAITAVKLTIYFYISCHFGKITKSKIKKYINQFNN